MPKHVVGMMWNKNEADLLPFTIPAAMEKVDVLFIADDGSSDSSWDIIQGFRSKNKDKVVHIQQNPSKEDPGQRQALLDLIRKKFPLEQTWVQVIESDIMIIDTDVREAIREQAVKEIAVSWHLLNAARKPGTWAEADKWPIWEDDIRTVMPYFHWLEPMLYTFKLLPDLYFQANPWRPWPRGFSKYVPGDVMRTSMRLASPILGHYGYRGPTHFYAKYRNMGAFHKRHKAWMLGSPDEVERTVPFFNGVWNKDMQLLNRQGWLNFVKHRPW